MEAGARFVAPAQAQVALLLIRDRARDRAGVAAMERRWARVVSIAIVRVAEQRANAQSAGVGEVRLGRSGLGNRTRSNGRARRWSGVCAVLCANGHWRVRNVARPRQLV